MVEWYRRPGNAEKVRTRARTYRDAHLEEVRAMDRARGYRIYDLLKVEARKTVHRAIQQGDLTREACETCGAEPAHAHHDDYEKPLDVRWLCAACHGIEHRVIA